MCRNIKTLFNFEPPATEEEIRAASAQFVRKLSGFSKPSQVNQEAFERAVEDGPSRNVAHRLARHERAGARSRNRSRQGPCARGEAIRPVGPVELDALDNRRNPHTAADTKRD